MKNYFPAILAVMSLMGLSIIQYQLLRSGIQLEKQRFERQVYAALQEVDQGVNHNTRLRQQILRLQHQRFEPLAIPEQALPQRVTDTLFAMLRAGLSHHGLGFPFHFSLAEDFLGNTIAGEPFQGVGQDKKMATYSHRLRGLLQQECNCNLVLHLQVEQLFGLLRKRLNYLLAPSVAFLLVLFAALFLLVRNLNRQKQLGRVKNDFINNLAHELKTPAFSISLLSKLLRQALQTGSAEKTEGYLMLIEQENEQIKGHIEKVLELASLENTRYQLELKDGHLHPLLEVVAAPYRFKAGQTGGSLDCSLEAANDQIRMDEVHLRNAIQNLLDNALKYSPGAPAVGLHTRNTDRAILVLVTDQGAGIAPVHQQRIFEKFYRGHPNLGVKGFGLGLSYVQEIIRAHHGKVSLESTLGQGSCFTLEIPLAGGSNGRRPLRIHSKP